jgi:hypothetical protein
MLAEMNAKRDANMMKMAAIRPELEETVERRRKHFMMVRWNTMKKRRRLRRIPE